MRLIDADALKARFYMKDDCSDCHACDYDETYIEPMIICSTIDDMPTIESEGWIERNKDRILQAGKEGQEVEFWIGGRLFAIREKAQ